MDKSILSNLHKYPLEAKRDILDLFDELDECKAREKCATCLLYTSPSPRDVEESRMPSSA